MRYLNFKVDAQRIEKDGDFSGLVSGTSGYLQACFQFSSEWDGLFKIAEFNRYETQDPVAVAIVGGRCEIPSAVLSGRTFGVRIVGRRGGKQIRTSRCVVKQEE